MGFFDLVKRKFGKKFEAAPSSVPKAVKAEKVVQPQEVVLQKKQEGLSLRDDRGVLLKPVVTEKATRLASIGQYTFVVVPRASKGAIKDAVQHRYGVKPASVTVQRYEGSKVRFGRRVGATKGFKKAIVTLAKGQSIDVLKTGKKE